MADIFQDTTVNTWGSTEYNQWVSSVVEGMAPFKINPLPSPSPRTSPRGSQGREWGCLGSFPYLLYDVILSNVLALDDVIPLPVE